MEKPREWTVEGYKEFRELHRRNYELDNLWGPDEKKCSEEFRRFVELEQFYLPIDNTRLMFEAYQRLLDEAEALRKALNELYDMEYDVDAHEAICRFDGFKKGIEK